MTWRRTHEGPEPVKSCLRWCAMVDPDILTAVSELDEEGLRAFIGNLSDVEAAAFLSILPQDKNAAQASPIKHACAVDQAFVSRPHLEYLSDRIAQAAHDVTQGISRRLIIQMPPRSGKTTLTTLHTPAWVLSQHPDWSIALTSHDGTLAAGWGRQIRRWAEDGHLPGVTIAADAGAVKEWETPQGGGVLSRSIRESFIGRGAKMLLIDDPHKDFADAHSEVSRDAVWDWWLSVAQTRLEPPSLVIVVLTRWHEDDLAGRLLSDDHEGDPADWEVLRFPALAESADTLGRSQGDPLLSPLLPDETPETALVRWAETRQAVGSYVWSAMYQQSPSPSKGTIFDVDWWHFYDDPPATFDRTLTSWDCAFKGTSTSDYVVGQRWGCKGADRYLLDQVRGRWSFTETLDHMRSFCQGTTENLVEDKANGTAVIDVLKREVPGMIPVNPTNSKEARARAVTPQIEAGNVHLPMSRPGSWVSEFLDECRAFPSGAHDDMVDAMTQALSRLTSAGGRPRVARATGRLPI